MRSVLGTAIGVTLLLVACSGSDEASTVSVAESLASTTDASVAATTPAEATAPTTTQALMTLSREARLAVITCTGSITFGGLVRADLASFDDPTRLNTAIDACKDAALQIKADGTAGENAIGELLVSVQKLNVALAEANFNYVANGSDAVTVENFDDVVNPLLDSINAAVADL